jgi:predicted pyridoxine 5'-phosphate oxidase superfamily flavin-nucleotide-binding protein
MGEQQITSVDELVAVVGVPLPRVANKVRPKLHQLDREWLAASPFCLVATADENGACDVSPKGDPPGHLAYVIDDSTIALAERPGNRRADGYKNVLANPHVGLIFLIPGRGDTLRINGRARLVCDAPFFDDRQGSPAHPRPRGRDRRDLSSLRQSFPALAAVAAGDLAGSGAVSTSDRQDLGTT